MTHKATKIGQVPRALLDLILGPDLTGAACFQHPFLSPDAWYPPTTPWGREDPEIDPEVRAACETCPVRSACLQDALDRDEKHGIRAGLMPGQRLKLVAA